jgi:hypothetical protein
MGVALPCLCLDGATRDRVRGGILGDGVWLAEQAHEGDPTAGVAEVTRALLAQSGLDWPDLRAAALNQGPGSILGIRAVAVSLQAWSALRALPILGWSGHLAAAWAAVGSCDGVVSEGRSGRWVVQRLGASSPSGGLEEVAPSDLAGLRLRPVSGGFRHALPAGLGAPVDPWPLLPRLLVSRALAGPTDHPDALNSPAVHALWSGRRHGSRAP